MSSIHDITDTEQWTVSTTLKERWPSLNIELQLADAEIRETASSASALPFSGRSMKPALLSSKLPSASTAASSITVGISNTVASAKILMISPTV